MLQCKFQPTCIVDVLQAGTMNDISSNYFVGELYLVQDTTERKLKSLKPYQPDFKLVVLENEGFLRQKIFLPVVLYTRSI